MALNFDVPSPVAAAAQAAAGVKVVQQGDTVIFTVNHAAGTDTITCGLGGTRPTAIDVMRRITSREERIFSGGR